MSQAAAQLKSNRRAPLNRHSEALDALTEGEQLRLAGESLAQVTARCGSRRSAGAVGLHADGDGRGLIASDDDQDDEQASIRRGDRSKRDRNPGLDATRRS